VIVDTGAAWYSIDRIRMRTLTRLATASDVLREALHRHTSREWRDPKGATGREIRPCVLYDPPRSCRRLRRHIKHFARIAEKLSFDVEPITRRQLAELASMTACSSRDHLDRQPTYASPAALEEGMP